MNASRTLFSIIAFATALALPTSAAEAVDSHSKGAKPAHISGGQEFKLTDYLVPGKTTVFDFYSDYCPPCRAIGPYVEKLHENRSDVAVVEVNINRPGIDRIDWQSPVAKQYRLESIPHFIVFGPEGKLKAEGEPAYQLVVGWLN